MTEPRTNAAVLTQEEEVALRTLLAELRESEENEQTLLARRLLATLDGARAVAADLIRGRRAAGVHLGDEGLDVERLATVICHREHVTGYVWCRRHKDEAEAIAAEYARLTEGDSR